ncbi:hypothetical protein EYF80_044837 [Liparis tanakae]|uniref:Uncharacterized protein n=1 Tax=Liparis tanakae TaxID=230148 RepID=A0A4Z2FW01_9TELE|nr:hypothetical protein EYF80_044837 [Liparis tanakae]
MTSSRRDQEWGPGAKAKDYLITEEDLAKQPYLDAVSVLRIQADVELSVPTPSKRLSLAEQSAAVETDRTPLCRCYWMEAAAVVAWLPHCYWDQHLQYKPWTVGEDPPLYQKKVKPSTPLEQVLACCRHARAQLDARRLGGLRHRVAPPSITQPGSTCA